MDIIDQLKKNEKPFGLMSKEMRDKANKIGPQEFQYWANRKWAGPNSYFGPENIAYRLRSNFVEEPKIVKCAIYAGSAIKGFNAEVYDFGDKKELNLLLTPDGYVRIGFLYEDGCITTSTRRYKNVLLAKNFVGHYFDICEIASVIVLTPTHVLFRGGSI